MGVTCVTARAVARAQACTLFQCGPLPWCLTLGTRGPGNGGVRADVIGTELFLVPFPLRGWACGGRPVSVCWADEKKIGITVEWNC